MLIILVLNKAPKVNFVGVFLYCIAHSLLLTHTQPFVPLIPAFSAVGIFQSHKKSVGVYPVKVGDNKLAKALFGLFAKALVSLFEHLEGVFVNSGIIDPCAVAAPVYPLKILLFEITLTAKSVKINKIRVACMDRETLVGGIAVACG